MKNVIITGCSRGIGYELVKIFSENDFNVITLSRNIEPISDLNLKNVKSYYLDISIPDYVKEALTRFQHPTPKQAIHAPSKYVPPDYGIKKQREYLDTSMPMTP